MARNGAISIDFVITDGKDGLRRLTMDADAAGLKPLATYQSKNSIQHETMVAHHMEKRGLLSDIIERESMSQRIFPYFAVHVFTEYTFSTPYK